MEQVDQRIIQALQYDFPLCERPYDVLADKLGLSCEELWSRIERLIADGVIRRLGASLDSRKLGYWSTLAAVRVEPDLVDRAAEFIGRFSEVTHSYLRKGDFNIWFTIIAPSQRRIEDILEQIREALSLNRSAIINVPVKRMFKLDARFSTTQ